MRWSVNVKTITNKNFGSWRFCWTWIVEYPKLAKEMIDQSHFGQPMECGTMTLWRRPFIGHTWRWYNCQWTEAGQGAIGDLADDKDNEYEEISKASSKVLRTHVKLVKMHWLKSLTVIVLKLRNAYVEGDRKGSSYFTKFTNNECKWFKLL